MFSATDISSIPTPAGTSVPANTNYVPSVPQAQIIADAKNQSSNVDSTESPSLTPPTTKATTSAEKTTTYTTTTSTTTSTTTPTTTLSTTTAAPTTSTTSAPTTQAPVTPLPPPSTGKWMIKDENNTVCVIVQMAVQFNISYTNTSTNVVSTCGMHNM